MKWYYAENGKQMGPVEEPVLDDLVRSGVVRDDTLVWSEGMANWQPHQAVRGAKPEPPPPFAPPESPSPDLRYCAECGRPFPAGELVNVGNASICAQCKPAYLQRIRESVPGSLQGTGARRYAGFWIRFVARLIDGLILTIPMVVLFMPLAIFAPLGAPGMRGPLALLPILLQVAYEAYFVSTRGATPGKMAMGLRIIRADGSPVPAGLAAGRYLAEYFISTLLTLTIGCIMAAFDHEKRALHDRICQTRVIHVA